MSQLSLIDRNDHRQNPHSNSCYESPHVEHRNHNTGSLDDAADHEDDASEQDGPSSAERVGVRGEECSAEATTGEESDDCAGASVAFSLEEEGFEGVGRDYFGDDSSV